MEPVAPERMIFIALDDTRIQTSERLDPSPSSADVHLNTDLRLLPTMRVYDDVGRSYVSATTHTRTELIFPRLDMKTELAIVCRTTGFEPLLFSPLFVES